MKTGRLLLSLVISAAMTAPLLAANKLGPGKYTVSVSPQFDEQTADRIEKGLDSIKQLTSIDAKPADSSIHFKVKDDARLDVAQLKDAVKAAVPDAQVGEPQKDSNETMGSSGSQSDSSGSSSNSKSSY
jgi:hypothetical protein